MAHQVEHEAGGDGWVHFYLPEIAGTQEGHKAKIWHCNQQNLWEVRGWPFIAAMQTSENRKMRWKEALRQAGWTAIHTDQLINQICCSQLSLQRFQKRRRDESLNFPGKVLPEQAIPTELFLMLLVRSCLPYGKSRLAEACALTCFQHILRYSPAISGLYIKNQFTAQLWICTKVQLSPNMLEALANVLKLLPPLTEIIIEVVLPSKDLICFEKINRASKITGT